MEINLDLGDDVSDLEAQLLISETQINKAVKRALKKTAKWIETHSKREMGKELKIPQKLLTLRYRRSFFTKEGRHSAHLWFGFAAIRPLDISNNHRYRNGELTIGSHQFEDGFIATMKNGHRDVYRRSGGGKRTKRADGQWTELPIEKVGFHIDVFADRIMERYYHRAEARFKQILKQELHFVLNVENKL